MVVHNGGANIKTVFLKVRLNCYENKWRYPMRINLHVHDLIILGFINKFVLITRFQQSDV